MKVQKSTPSSARLHAAERAARNARARLAQDLETLMADAGITLAALAREAGVPYQQLWQMMAGRARPTIETFAKLSVPLGAGLSLRLYPNTGPLIRDRHQARVIEALLPLLHPRWRRTTEVGVRQPARGWIDLVLHEPREAVVVAVEVESDIRRIEQQVRWAKIKAESLPSSVAWPRDGGGAGEPLRISQLLIVRRTRSARATALQFGAQLAIAYPAHPEDALAALTDTKSWPGPALLWADVLPDRVRFLPTR